MNVIQDSNQTVRDIAALLCDNPRDPTYGMKGLGMKPLDHSLESLLKLNAYLESIRKDKKIDDFSQKIILRCGAHVGEVLREDGLSHFDWFA